MVPAREVGFVRTTRRCVGPKQARRSAYATRPRALHAGTGDLGLAYRAVFALVAVYLVLGAALLAFVREPLRDTAEGMPGGPR